MPNHKPHFLFTSSRIDSVDGAPKTASLRFERYNFNNPRRGKAVIINNEHFNYQLTHQNQREGTNVDASALESVFVMLGFEVVRFDNLTSLDISMNLRAGESRG